MRRLFGGGAQSGAALKRVNTVSCIRHSVKKLALVLKNERQWGKKARTNKKRKVIEADLRDLSKDALNKMK